MTPTRLPPDVTPFVCELVDVTRAVLGEDLVGLWAVGSLATGDARGPGSDVDVLVAIRTALGQPRRNALGVAVVELGRRCPWAGVEYVVYRTDVLAAAAYPLVYEVNINAGPTRDTVVRSAGDPPHWFLLDVAMARESALALVGPAAREVIGRPSRTDVLRALSDSLRWHGSNEATSPSGVLNACRALCWVSTGSWRSKTGAGRWALERAPADADLPTEAVAAITAALAARTGEGSAPPAPAAGARVLTAAVLERTRRALVEEQDPGRPPRGRM